MNSQRKITRRRALQIAAGAATPLFIPSRLRGKDSPSNQIVMGFIGVGWMGEGNLNAFLGQRDCRVVAIADVDENHLKKAVERVNKHYKNQDCKAYKDFRELVGRKDIDAVCISTPDHWHAIRAGPAQRPPFNACRSHKNWRWNYAFGGGQLLDWIGHHCDIAHWGLSSPKYGVGPDDRIGPLEVSAKAEFPPKDAVWNTAT